MKHVKALRLPLLGNLTRPVQQRLLAVAAIVAVAGLYLYQLGRFIRPSTTELQAFSTNDSLSLIVSNPLNLPYKILDHLLLQLPIGSLATRGRLASVVLALGCAGLFFILARRWHGTFNGVLASILFVTSTWLLQTGRFGASLIALTLMVLALVSIASWTANTTRHDRALLGNAVVGGLALTIPGGVWFVLATALVCRRNLLVHLAAARPLSKLAAGLIPCIVLLLVGFASLQDRSLLLQLAGLPALFPEWSTLAKQAAQALSFGLVRGPFMPEIWLAHTPLLDAGSSALLIFGGIFYWRHRRTTRVTLLAAFGLLSIIMISLHGAPALALIAPVLYLVAATGLAALRHHWDHIFPRNPFARILSTALILALLFTITIFHTQRYFVAWRQSPDTREAYQSTDSQLRRSYLVQ